MTRLTALTDNASCICGSDPGDEELGYYRRKVLRVVDQITIVPESDEIDVVVPTQHMYYNGQEVTPGTPFRITSWYTEVKRTRIRCTVLVIRRRYTRLPDRLL